MNLNWEEFSNSHLLINDLEVEKIAKSLVVGDQIRIKGRLVNVKANLIGKPGTFDATEYTWNSGVGKSGEGGGGLQSYLCRKNGDTEEG